MKVIFVNPRQGNSKTIELGRWSRALLSMCALGLPLGLVAIGYLAGQQSEARTLRGATLDSLEEDLDRQAREFSSLESRAGQQLQALTLNLAELQARMTRLDALGEHLTAMAGLEDGEFDFSAPPPLGGALTGELGAVPDSGGLGLELETFGARLRDREQQLGVLDSLLANRRLEEQERLSGQPVEKGWVSSGYGRRTDPFTGRTAMHNGIDFAAREGSSVLAVAAGVVTWAGRKDAYGNTVEVSHGDGLVTRYSHNKQNLVQPGDLVRKGEPIALMGSTGRSTGSHVHFEVYKNGRQVDPSSYIRRTHR